MLHVVRLTDIIGQENLIVFSTNIEAKEFMDLGLKRWHFSSLRYHWYSPEEYVEEKMKITMLRFTK